MTGPILVINPNSSRKVTTAIERALTPYQRPGLEFECVDIPQSPATIVTTEDVARSGILVAELAHRRTDASAVVIACFSDPGLEMARELASCPVIGIQQAGILTALAWSDQIGIIALSPQSIPRHLLRIRQMGVESRLADEVALENVSASDVGTSEDAFRQTIKAGRKLITKGAGAIVLGCAGFAPRRRELESELNVPIVDPVLAAAVMALGVVLT